MTILINTHRDIITTRAALRPQGNFLFHIDPAQIPLLQQMPAWDAKSYDVNPNLFFLWMICMDSATIRNALRAMATLEEVLYSDDEITFLSDMYDPGNVGVLRPWAQVLAHLFAVEMRPAKYSKAKNSADILRFVHTLQKKFNVKNISHDANSTDPAKSRHKSMIYTMITASHSFLGYRRRLQTITQEAAIIAGKHDYKKDVLSVVLKQIQYEELIRSCKTTEFKRVIAYEEDLAHASNESFGMTTNSLKYSRTLYTRNRTRATAGDTTVSYHNHPRRIQDASVFGL